MSDPNSSDDDACACSEGQVRGSHKRKEIHNEVERRRKDKINIGILRLASLLPDKDPKKQSKNGILERASNYITYLKSLNEKLVADRVTDVEATVFASLRKQIRELEELNASYVKLLSVAGIPLTSCPEEIWEHAPRKYTLKNSPEKQQALLSAAKALTVPCAHHGSTPVVTESTGNVCVSVAVTSATTTTTTTACSMGAIATTMAPTSTNSMVVTQALPSAPVMSTTQPPAMTMLQQQPLVGPATAGSVMSQPILVLNDQGLPVLQNVVTFQNTSIILNPQGAITRTPVSAVSFPGTEMLPVQMANQLTDDLSHHQVAAQSALGGIVQCDPTKPKETRLCGMHTPVQGTAFLPGPGVVMNQPMLSFGAGAMLTSQNAAPAMGSAFLLPSGQIIPVVTQAPVMAAASLNQQNATGIHPSGGIPCVSACATSNSFVNGMGKVTTAHDSLRVTVTGRPCATTCQDQVNNCSISSAASACSPMIVPAGSSLQMPSKSHATTTCQSVLSSKTITLHEHAKTKTPCVVHSTSKQPLCSIRPKPQQPVPDSSQNKPSGVRKGNKKLLQRSPSESVAKKPRIGDAVARTEMEGANRGMMPLPAAATSQPSEGVSSTSNVVSGMSSKEASPLTTDILAQATESIFSAGLAELPPSSAVAVTRADACGTGNKDSAPQSTVSNADSQGDARSSSVRTYGTSKSVERQKASSNTQHSDVCGRLEVVSNSEPSVSQNTVQHPPKRSDIFQHASEITTRNEGACVEQQVVQTSVLKDVDHSVQDAVTGNSERRDISTLSLHSIVMEENIDISPSVSSTTFTDSYVSASNSLSESITKMSDCTTSILCQLTPPSSKNSEDGGGKAFVSSTDSLASENELPLILSIPDDDGHASLNSNSNPGLSFPPLSPGDQLEQELGNGNKGVESSNNLPPFSLTPPVTPVVTTAASPLLQHQDLPTITPTANKEKKTHEGSFSVNYATDVSDAYSTLRNQVQATQTISGSRKQQQQGCQHNAGALQPLQSLPASKPPLDNSHHNAGFVSSAPAMPQMNARSPHFSMASNSIMRSFETEFTTPKSVDTSLHCNKAPPSPCRMVRDNSRSATPNKTQASQFAPPLNPYQSAPTSFPCTYHLSSRGNINSTAQNHSAISNYSAEALIGLSTSQPQSLYQVSPACTQESGVAQMLSCSQSARAHISYSAESLIQSQSTNSKKDSSKDASFSGGPSLGGRQPSYQPSLPHQNMHSHHVAASTPQASQQPIPSPGPSPVTPESRQHTLHPSSSCTTGNASYHTVVSAASQQSSSHQHNPSTMTRVHSEGRPRSQRTPSSTCATASTSYHTVASTAQQNLSPVPCAVTSESRTHTLHPLPPSSCGSLGTYHMTTAQRNSAGSSVRYPPQAYKDNVPHSSSCASQLPQHMSHSYQQNTEKNPIHGVMAQNYPYPNFSTGHQSPSCFGPYPPPPPTSVGRMNSSCLQTNPRQASFGGHVPTPGGQQHQQQGCLFSSTANSPIISLPPDLSAQCSGPSPVFSSLPQHCSQPPHLVNNLIPTPFQMSGAQTGNSVPPPILGEVEKRREKGVADGGHCAEAEKQSKSSKSKKGKSSSSMTTPVAPPYFPDFSRSESHPLPPLPPVSSSLQKPLHSAPPAWQQSKPPSHCIDNECGPLFRPQSQNSININFHAPGPPPFTVNHHHHHHHSPTQRVPQVAPNAMPSGVSQSHRGNCAVAPSHHVPNFNLSNIFPDIGTGPNDAVISLGAPVKLQLQQEHGAGAGQQSRGASAHFYPSGRVLHNSFNPILPPHNNFVPPSHHPPSFSNVIPPLSFPMHEH
ncbi:mucin-5AC-like [Ornithodoros turicata]|uniref:mucin-5AC-like n=1 Tax=Ornithodoros turicata TaxID=34597 RepID=UPI00313983BD